MPHPIWLLSFHLWQVRFDCLGLVFSSVKEGNNSTYQVGGLQGFEKAIGFKFSAGLPIHKCSISIHSLETELAEAVRRAEESSVIVRKPTFRNAEQPARAGALRGRCGLPEPKLGIPSSGQSLIGRVGEGETATAKSLQSCPTLCNPMDGSPQGSPIPGILQARTLEWVAISFSNA